jgi:hypothetical protein
MRRSIKVVPSSAEDSSPMPVCVICNIARNLPSEFDRVSNELVIAKGDIEALMYLKEKMATALACSEAKLDASLQLALDLATETQAESKRVQFETEAKFIEAKDKYAATLESFVLRAEAKACDVALKNERALGLAKDIFDGHKQATLDLALLTSQNIERAKLLADEKMSALSAECALVAFNLAVETTKNTSDALRAAEVKLEMQLAQSELLATDLAQVTEADINKALFVAENIIIGQGMAYAKVASDLAVETAENTKVALNAIVNERIMFDSALEQAVDTIEILNTSVSDLARKYESIKETSEISIRSSLELSAEKELAIERFYETTILETQLATKVAQLAAQVMPLN